MTDDPPLLMLLSPIMSESHSPGRNGLFSQPEPLGSRQRDSRSDPDIFPQAYFPYPRYNSLLLDSGSSATTLSFLSAGGSEILSFQAPVRSTRDSTALPFYLVPVEGVFR